MVRRAAAAAATCIGLAIAAGCFACAAPIVVIDVAGRHLGIIS